MARSGKIIAESARSVITDKNCARGYFVRNFTGTGSYNLQMFGCDKIYKFYSLLQIFYLYPPSFFYLFRYFASQPVACGEKERKSLSVFHLRINVGRDK